MNQQTAKPGRNNPEIAMRTGECDQLTMRMKLASDALGPLYQKETILLGARLAGYVNLCEEKEPILNVRLELVHWPPDIEGGAIPNFPELDLRIQTLVALQEGYRSVEKFVEDCSRKSSPQLRQLFIKGERTMYLHRIVRNEIRPWKKP